MFNKKRLKAANEKKRSSHIIGEDSNFAIKEAYKSTRTNMIFALNEAGTNVVLVSSSYPREGKTTTAVNLAITFAQVKAKILLVDCDLRKPRLHKMFNLNETTGLSNIILNDANLDGINLQSSYPNLDVLSAGPVPANPIEVLSSAKMKAFISEVSKKYDYVFIDTPPINVVTDAILLSSIVTGMFLVVRQDITDHRAVKELMAKLELNNIKPLGFILNDTDELKNKYKYRYRYGYKYGYKYSNYQENYKKE